MKNTSMYAILLIGIAIVASVAGYYLWQTSQSQLKDIVDTAIDSGSFTTLVTAVEAADLVGVLKGDGPFTVFAPSDDAFAALPQGVLDDLLADETALAEVLAYHVVAGKYMAVDVVALNYLTTLQGGNLTITMQNGVKIDSANIVLTDTECRNGVIHVIDVVLIP